MIVRNEAALLFQTYLPCEQHIRCCNMMHVDKATRCVSHRDMSTEPNIAPINEMTDVFGIFKNTELAEALNVGPSTISEMKRRKSIPPEYWSDLIPAARAKGRDDLTFELMSELARKAKRKVAA